MSRLALRKRKGFTLVELLVVIAIIGVLIGLLLPAVQKVREAGNRAKCLNNAKQLALAAINASDQHKKLPPAFGLYANKTGSLFYHLLPFIEQRGIYDDLQGPSVFNFSTGTGVPNSGSSRAAVYTCPSDISGSTPGQDKDAAGQTWGTTNYGGNWLVFSPGTIYQLNGSAAQIPGSSRIPEGFKDGVSNTVFFSEKFAVCGSTGGSRWAYPPSVTFNPVAPPGNYGGFFNFTGFTSANPFGWYFEKYQESADQATCKSNLAQTPHTGGTIIVAMGDGSAKSVSGLNVPEDVNSANPAIKALATAAVQLGSNSISWRASITPSGFTLNSGVVSTGQADKVGDDWD